MEHAVDHDVLADIAGELRLAVQDRVADVEEIGAIPPAQLADQHDIAETPVIDLGLVQPIDEQVDINITVVALDGSSPQ